MNEFSRWCFFKGLRDFGRLPNSLSFIWCCRSRQCWCRRTGAVGLYFCPVPAFRARSQGSGPGPTRAGSAVALQVSDGRVQKLTVRAVVGSPWAILLICGIQKCSSSALWNTVFCVSGETELRSLTQYAKVYSARVVTSSSPPPPFLFSCPYVRLLGLGNIW